MRKELKRYNSIGNKAGIILFCRKTLTGKNVDIPSLKSTCSFINDVDLNVPCALMAFEDMGLLKISGDTCISENNIYPETDSSEFMDSICKNCLNMLIDDEYIDSSFIRYNESLNAYTIPKNAFKLGCAVFRNMLITLGALLAKDSLYIITPHIEKEFESSLKRKKTTQEQLMTLLEREREIGEAGEAFVLEYEKSRCPFIQRQKQGIKQISAIDVSAGYDIISYEDEKSFVRRYIEVKTFIGSLHFNWSENEIESSKLRGKQYFIYLVDYNKIGTENYSPIIIKDPYKNVIQGNDWNLSPTSYFVKPLTSALTLGLNEREEGILDNVLFDHEVHVFINRKLIFVPDASIWSIMYDCFNEYGAKYEKMKLKNWYNIINSYITSLCNNPSIERTAIIKTMIPESTLKSLEI